MDENTPTNPADPNASQQPADQPPPKKKRRRRWPWVILGLIVALLVLVALLPTLISTGAGRSFAVGQANNYINGKLDVADWSIGWTTGVTLEGVKLDDQQGRRVAEIARVRVPMSLIAAARGNYDLGEVVIDKPNLVNLEINPDGSTNLDKLVKESGEKVTKAPEPAKGGESKLPDLKGKVVVSGARATVTYHPPAGQQPIPPIQLDNGDVTVTIPDINSPITNDVKLAYRVGQSPPGTISVSGTVDAIENNVVNVDKLAADEKVTLAQVDLAAAEPFLQSPDAKTTLSGVADGTLQLKAAGLNSAGVDGQLNVKDFAYGGDALKGDVYKSAGVAIPISVATDAAGANDTLVTIKTLKVDTDHVALDVSGSATQNALMNLAAQKKPGAKGLLSVAVNTKDLPGLVNTLRNTLAIQKDTQIQSGELKTRVDLAMTEDAATVKQVLDAVAAGTNAGKPIKLEPIHLDTAATAIPTADGKMPDLRDLALNLTSGFATIKGGGASLASLNMTGNADLARLRGQLGQFADLGKLDLNGTADLQVTSKGDLTRANGSSDVNATVNLKNVVVTGLADGKSVNEPRVAVQALATLVAGPAGGSVEQVTKTTLTVQSGDATAPVIDVLLNAGNVDLKRTSVDRFDLARLNVDLARAQRQYAAFVPQDMNLNGNLTVAASGSYKDDTATFDNLSVDTSDKLITLKKGAAPLVVSNKKDGVAANGELAIGSDLKKLDNVLKAFGQQLQSGVFNATVKLASQPKQPTTIDLAGGVTNLTVTTNQQPIQNEKIALSVKASASPEFDVLNVASVVVDSAFAKTTVSDTIVRLNGDGVFDMLQQLKAQIAVPDLAKTYAVVQAFAPPATQPTRDLSKPIANQTNPIFTSNPTVQPTADPNAPPTTQPLNIGGEAVVQVDLRREGGVTKINLPQIAASKVSLTRGNRRFAFDKPIDIKLAADLGTKKVPTTASTQPVEQVDQLRVTQLTGDLGGVAMLAAPENVVLANLTGDKPSANGKITVNGSLEPLTRLLSVIQDADPMPYRGDYAIAQNVGTDAGKIALKGEANINQFVVPDAKTGKPAFTEERVVLSNDLLADTNTKTATINRVVLNMARSEALGLDVKGTVRDWENKRVFENLVVEMPYDLAKVWEIVRPMLDAETQKSLADLKVAGQHKSVITVGGSYPAYGADGKTELPFNEAFKSVAATGDFTVGSFSYSGAEIKELVVPFYTDKGQVITLYANRPKEQRAAKPADFNGGTLDINSILVDMTGAEGARISIGKNQKLIAGATINKFLGDSLGKFINPVFANATRAEGLLDVTVVSCDKVSLAELKTPNSGRAELLFSLNQMDIANPLGDLLLGGALKQVGLGSHAAETEAFRGQIKNARIVLDKGVISQNIVMEIGNAPAQPAPTPGAAPGAVAAAPKQPKLYPLAFSGTVNTANLAQSLLVNIPSSLLRNDEVEKIFPEGIPVTLKGFTTKPQPDWGNFARKFIEGQAKSRLGNVLGGAAGGTKEGGKDGGLGGIIGDVLGGQKPQQQTPPQQPAQQRGSAPAAPAQPQPRQPKNPLGGLFDELAKPKPTAPPATAPAQPPASSKKKKK
jgi:hypothetical protein